MKIETLPECKVVRSRRKTISLEMKHDGMLWIRVPQRLPLRDIRSFLEEHRVWILKKHEQVQQNLKTYPPLKFQEGERFLLLGKSYPLCIQPMQKEDIQFTEKGFSLGRDGRQKIKSYLFEWYRYKAEHYFTSRLRVFSEQLNLSYGTLKLSRAKGMWGVCTFDGNIRLNWRLILAPSEIIDYVIVHELSHIKYPNHSNEFWQYVGEVIPNVSHCRHWLHVHTNELLQYS